MRWSFKPIFLAVPLIVGCEFLFQYGHGLNISSASAAALAKSATPITVDSETKEFDGIGLKKIEIKNITGFIKLTAKSDAQALSNVLVRAHKNEFAKTCVMNMARMDDRLVVNVRQSGFINSDDCKVDLELEVPKNVDLDLTLGRGDIGILGTDGTLKFKLGSGNVTANGTFPMIVGESGTGKIFMTGLAGGGSLKSGNTNVDLTFARVPLKGELAITVASGNVSLHFAHGTKIQSKFTSVSGHFSSEIDETPSAEFKVSTTTVAGALNIKAY